MNKSAINLLPVALAPKTFFINFAKNLKKLAILGFVALIITATVSITIFILFTNQINGLIKEEEDLKKSIKALEETEQRLILVQDRLTKADNILSQTKLNDEVPKAKSFIDDLPEKVIYSNVAIAPNNFKINLFTDDSEALAELFTKIIVSGKYQKVTLRSLNFNSEKGYSTSIDLNL
ncbi:hypothetical protein A2Z22_00180 [Candidatus Woesebacteria bacterium RBG_16_34_12]|uniref:Fimbrial assembly protein n=1 Tax=Candidatus Woesebacteria bacterium RBG_16_34_12 TaxID=1802480 RepID=A0A1F7X902_9BACT|nr:MAG: hypothetical protein A2Z22_00180 [Candidatus Woesebacteria bacterium RBG_16_34_12]